MPEQHSTGPVRQRWLIASTDEVLPGNRKIVEVAGKSIGLFNVGGEFIAVLDVCPHELAPVCRGRLGGTTLTSAPGEFRWGREGEIFACPWHGWEFDLRTGQAVADRRRLHRYPVTVEDGAVYVSV